MRVREMSEQLQAFAPLDSILSALLGFSKENQWSFHRVEWKPNPRQPWITLTGSLLSYSTTYYRQGGIRLGRQSHTKLPGTAMHHFDL